MSITLIVVGVGLLLAAILGGGVEVWKIKIPKIPGRSQQIAVGILGALLLCAGWLNGPPDEPPVITGTRPLQPRPPDPPVAVATLVGTVALSHHAVEFSERHTDYSITASANSTGEFSARLDAQGQFRIVSVPQAPPHTVSWGVSRPSEFVIWPLAHPSVPAGEELRGFRFQRLSDVLVNEQRRMFEAVTSGNFDEADERFSTILQLFERLGVRNASTDDPIANRIRRWRFTVHRDLAAAAAEFRTTLGRSNITDQQVQTERKWRRTMINVALEQPSVGQQLRDFARAARGHRTDQGEADDTPDPGAGRWEGQQPGPDGAAERRTATGG